MGSPFPEPKHGANKSSRGHGEKDQNEGQLGKRLQKSQRTGLICQDIPTKNNETDKQADEGRAVNGKFSGI